MSQCAKILAEDGIFYLSLSKGQFTRWNIQQMALRTKFYLTAEVPLKVRDWPLWELKRHQNGKSFKDRIDSCYHFSFGLLSGKEEIKEHINLFLLPPIEAHTSIVLQSIGIVGGGNDGRTAIKEGVGEKFDINPTPKSTNPIRMKKKRKMDALTEGIFKVVTINEGSVACDEFECIPCGRRFSLLQAIKTHAYVEHILKKNSSLCLEGSKGTGAERDEEVEEAEGATQINSATTCISTDSVGKGSSEFSCIDCGKMVKNEEALDQHRKAKHSGHFRDIKPVWAQSERLKSSSLFELAGEFECPACGLQFASENALVAHEEHGFQPEEVFRQETFVCDNCKKSCIDMRALRQHQNFCLSSKKTLLCSTLDPKL